MEYSMRSSSVLIIFGLFINLSHAIECSDLDPKVKNLVEDVSNINVDQKFAGSCAVTDEMAKNATWKDHIDEKINKIVRNADYLNLDEAFNDVLIDAKIEKKEYHDESPSKLREKGKSDYLFEHTHSFSVKNKVNSEKGLLRKKIKEKTDTLKKMAANKSCVHDAEFVIVPQNGFQTSDEKILSKEEALADVQKKIKEIENQEGVTVCSSPAYNYSALQPVKQKIQFELEDDVFFDDNQWHFSDAKSAKFKKMVDAKLKSNRPNCERKIKSVQIETSSSLLRNQIKDELGHENPQLSWDFKTLSTRRAEEIKNKIKESYGLREEQLNAGSLGSNGNGTSGPCPYKLVKEKNGTYNVIRNGIDEKELKKHRYGKINIEYQEVGDGCLKVEAPKISPMHNHYRTKCYSVLLNCINSTRK